MDVTLPAYGQRPGGMLSFAVLPAIEPLALAHVDDSRFGLCGHASLLTGELHRGNPFDPLFRLVGARWVYGDRRMGDMRLDHYAPSADSAAKLWRQESNAGLALLLSCIGIPSHMQAAPEGVTGFDPQAYPPKDFEAWGKIIGKFAKEQALVRQAGGFPTQRYNYYEITWEPDWGYKGSDADFIRMFETAREAIRANDPQGRLLGPKYGVLPRGLAHLERLLPMGLGKHLDGLSSHSYGSWPDRVLARDVRRLVQLAREHLPPDAKLMINELEGSFLHPKPFTEAQGAAASIRGHLIWLGEGFDTSWFFYVIGDKHGLFYPLMNDPAGATHFSPTRCLPTFATLTRLLEGTKTIGPIDSLGDEIKAYAFDRGGKTIVALWAADDAGSCAEPVRSVKLPVGPGEVTLYDPVGRATPLVARDGTVTVAVGPQPVYVLGVPAAAAPAARTDLAPGATLPADALAGEGTAVLFRGGREISLDGGQRLPRDIPPGDWLLMHRRPDGTLTAGRTIAVTAPLAIEELPADDRRPDRRTLRVANEWNEPVRGRVEILPAMNRYGHNTSARWEVIAPGAAPVESREVELAAGQAREVEFDLSAADGPKPGNVADLVVHDGLSPWRNSWGEDSIQVNVAIHPVAEGSTDTATVPGLSTSPARLGYAFFQELCFALKQGEPVAYRFEAPGAMKKGPLPPEAVRFAARRVGDETHYEIAIPWRELDPTRSGPPEEKLLGFGIVVNDVDLLDGFRSDRKALGPIGTFGPSPELGVIVLE